MRPTEFRVVSCLSILSHYLRQIGGFGDQYAKFNTLFKSNQADWSCLDLLVVIPENTSTLSPFESTDVTLIHRYLTDNTNGAKIQEHLVSLGQPILMSVKNSN